MKKSTLILVARLVITFALLAWALHKVHPGPLWKQAQSAQPEWLLGMLLLSLANTACATWRWSVLLRARTLRVPFPRLYRLFFVGAFFSMFLPSAVGGDAARMVLLAPDLEQRETAVSSVLVDRLAGMAAMILMALCATLAMPALRSDMRVVGSLLAITLVFLLGLLFLTNRALLRILERLLPTALAIRIKPTAQKIFSALAAYGQHPDALRKAFLLGLLVQVAACTTLWLAGIAFHLRIAPLYYFALAPVATACTTLPISINGWGLQDTLYIALFGLAGARPYEAVLLSLSVHTLRNANGLAGGVLFLLGRARPLPDPEAPRTEAV